MPVILWTDMLVFFMILGLSIFVYHLRKTNLWLRIQSRIKLNFRYKIAIVVLFVYGFIGFLDSLHFKENKDTYIIKSVLDLIMGTYAEDSEKTYSKPFAKYSLEPEITLSADGKLQEIYPPLLYPGRHILGTDKIGRDVFYLCMKSIRTGLIIGTATTLFMLPFALFLGMGAGFFGGVLDDCVQYVYTTLSSVPGVLLIAAMVLSLQSKIEADPEFRLLILCFILGITSWTSLCRLLRGETLKLRELEFVQAAITLGTSRFKIMMRHILPNLTHIIIITLVLDFSALVLAEAVLTYVGVGVSPTSYSFGNLINAARLEMARDPMVWWSLLGAFFFMFFLVFSANVFSDALQEALDPRV